MNLLGWVLCYTALFLNTGQCGKQASMKTERHTRYEKHVKYEQSSEITAGRKAYGKNDQKSYERHCSEKLPTGEMKCRDFTIESFPPEDKGWQKVMEGANCQECRKKILDGLTEEERKIAMLSQDEIQIKEEWIWPHEASDAGPGCGFPVCALIDARPQRFKSMCHLLEYIEKNKLTFRMFHIQKGDCYTTINQKGHKYEWGKAQDCNSYDKKWDIPFCLVDIPEERAHHFDNPCKAMKYLKHRKESISLYIGLGEKEKEDQCKHLLKDDRVYLHTEWFDIDEPCITGDLESAAQTFHYVHNYPASESFRFCNKVYLDDDFNVQTVSYNNEGVDPEVANQNTQEKGSNGGEFVCLNVLQKDKPGPPNYWFHRNIKCMDYRIQFRCKCLFGCKKNIKKFKEWSGWRVRVPAIKVTLEGEKQKKREITKTLWEECEWRPSVSTMFPNKDTWDAEIRTHMTWGTKEAPGLKNFKGHACGLGVFDAMYVLAMRLKDGKTATETGEVITKYTPAYGFLCINKNQPDNDTLCSNYAVKFCCKKHELANWGEWSKWSKCSKECGRGEKHRERKCLQDKPSETCLGYSDRQTAINYQTKVCNIMPCDTEEYAEWRSWTSWAACSMTCGDGFKQRSRTCITKSKDGEYPPFIDDKCPSKLTEFKTDRKNNKYVETCHCKEKECEIAAWEEWGPFSECSATCDIGTKRKERDCVNFLNMQKIDVETCKEEGGLEYHVDACTVKENCPIDGGMSDWSAWSTCTVHCGDGGTRTRHRHCTNPIPQHGGKPCDKDLKRVDKEECGANQKCPVPCVWSKWGEWSECDKKCYPPSFDNKGEFIKEEKKDNIGSRRRKRHKAQEAKHGGMECDENGDEQLQSCRVKKPCNRNCEWGEWGTWMMDCSPCFDENLYEPADFKNEFQERVRKVELQGTPKGECRDSKGKKIMQQQRMTVEDKEQRKCNKDGLLVPKCDDFYACWTAWSEWSECKGKCGKKGQRKQRRKCQLCPPGVKPDGYESEEKRKALEEKECSRFIQKSEELGIDTVCAWSDCPDLCQHVGWGPWDAWGACSLTCGKGKRVRARRCQGAGKDEIDYIVSKKVCGTRDTCETDRCGTRYKDKSGKLRQKQSEDCDKGECGSRDESYYYY